MDTQLTWFKWLYILTQHLSKRFIGQNTQKLNPHYTEKRRCVLEVAGSIKASLRR